MKSIPRRSIENAAITVPLLELLQLLNVYVARSSYRTDHHGGLATLTSPGELEEDLEDEDYNEEDGEDIDFEEDSPGNFEGDTLMLDQNAENDQKTYQDMWLISFPAVVLDEISSRETNEQLPFWKCYYQVCCFKIQK